jgi:hypothetical protein
VAIFRPVFAAPAPVQPVFRPAKPVSTGAALLPESPVFIPDTPPRIETVFGPDIASGKIYDYFFYITKVEK